MHCKPGTHVPSHHPLSHIPATCKHCGAVVTWAHLGSASPVLCAKTTAARTHQSVAGPQSLSGADVVSTAGQAIEPGPNARALSRYW